MKTTGLVLLLGLLGPVAHADVYRFVDEDGLEHFSDRRDDARFRLVLRDVKTPSATPDRAKCTTCTFSREIESAAQAEKLDAHLLRAVIGVESGFRADARSPKGAIGLMQLMPATARRFGATDPADPAQNISAGARYLRTLIAQFEGDLSLALAAYNAGEQAVQKYGGKIPPYRETRCYVPAVLRQLAKLQGQEIGSTNGPLECVADLKAGSTN
jgi:soluble lytic murein transglycosylase-like protein